MSKQVGAVQWENVARRIGILVAHICIFLLAGVAAFTLKVDVVALTSQQASHIIPALLVLAVTKITSYQAAKLNRRGMRYVSLYVVSRLLLVNLVASAVAAVLIYKVFDLPVPFMVLAADFLLSLLLSIGFRAMMRLAAEVRSTTGARNAQRNILIYGAGAAGMLLAREIWNDPGLAYNVCGFIDDSPRRKGVCISGLSVLGGGEQMKDIIACHQITRVLIAIPSATGPEMARILALCHECGVECKTVPGLRGIIEGKGLVGQIRDIAVEDLLGRTPIELRANEIGTSLKDRIVLVTGAAGSIGSELCRQIARYEPAGIVGYESAESPLFEIEREMLSAFPEVPFFAEIGNIQNRARLDQVFRQYQPSVVYHAAAYKHVPLMETHVFEAIRNNVFGTCNVAYAAAEHRVERFVMISTDKAVKSTSMMGATKRIAELVLQTMPQTSTQYSMVRFGNVLGSAGSVVPIFKKQIAAGGPVTVTHPEMRRYFMTIPEAAQLVLQAAAIAQPGQICVLDMGHPVKIVDLAVNLILLSGVVPGRDIKIEYSGMRPGEKLCEELSSLMEDTVATDHEKVRVFQGKGLSSEIIEQLLSDLDLACCTSDLGMLLDVVTRTVVDYTPSEKLRKQATAAIEARPA